MNNEKLPRKSVLDRFREKAPFEPDVTTPEWNKLTPEVRARLIGEMEVFFEEPTPLHAPQDTTEHYALFMAHQFAARHAFLRFASAVLREVEK